jgi:glycosyltransferase 2 family protein
MAARRSWKGLVLNVLLSLVAFGLLGWTVWSNRAKLAEVRARDPDLRLFVAAVGLYVGALLVTFLRWHRLVRALGLPFRLRDAVRLGFIGNVFNLVIPGAVGGDVIKAAFLCREQERKTQAVASMVIDRALGLLGLFVLAGAVGAFAWPSADVRVRNLIAFAWIMVACGTIGLAVLFTRPSMARSSPWCGAGASSKRFSTS